MPFIIAVFFLSYFQYVQDGQKVTHCNSGRLHLYNASYSDLQYMLEAILLFRQLVTSLCLLRLRVNPMPSPNTSVFSCVIPQMLHTLSLNDVWQRVVLTIERIVKTIRRWSLNNTASHPRRLYCSSPYILTRAHIKFCTVSWSSLTYAGGHRKQQLKIYVC
jgi:hypothetical protein